MLLRRSVPTRATSAASLVAALAVGFGTTFAGPEPHVIVGPAEPGTPLTLVIRVVDAQTDAPIADADLLLYQTDDAGAYAPSDPTDESTARLRAQGRVDAAGAFAVRTILPGEYPGAPAGNRHVHLEYVRAAGYATQGGVILFEHNVNDAVRSWALATGFGRVIEVVAIDGGWHGEVTIRLEPLR
jgi:protocatechuate 3,4-dioxygenase beta subunit